MKTAIYCDSRPGPFYSIYYQAAFSKEHCLFESNVNFSYDYNYLLRIESFFVFGSNEVHFLVRSSKIEVQVGYSSFFRYFEAELFLICS